VHYDNFLLIKFTSGIRNIACNLYSLYFPELYFLVDLVVKSQTIVVTTYKKCCECCSKSMFLIKQCIIYNMYLRFAMLCLYFASFDICACLNVLILRTINIGCLYFCHTS